MDTLSSAPQPKISESELLEFLTEYAASNDFPFAVWRLPATGATHLLISNKHKSLEADFVLETMEPGFIFTSFDRSKKIFLPADFLFTFENGQLTHKVDSGSTGSAAWLEDKFVPSSEPRRFKPAKSVAVNLPDQTDDSFLALINISLEKVTDESLEKVVPSRTRTVELPADFDVPGAFQKLSRKYPNALVSLVNIPGIGCWLGATPEILVAVEDNTTFRTVALAGTQPFDEGMKIRNVAWTQKEIEEQALVERYVISCFKKIRLREYEEHGPKTVIAGNLIHLRSDFTVDMKATNFPNLGTTMLELLHPTSAVCGMPLEPAMKFLKEHEGYDRSFYSGYLGPVNVNNHTNIFVNLRCMQLDGDKAVLYAGAGVTIDSIPERELEETEMKFNTLIKVIF
jgi:isochorismate synthase